MPQLKWDKLELLEYLSVLPQTDEDELSYGYQVVRGDIQMLLTIWQYESYLRLTLRHDGTGNQLLDLSAFVRGDLSITRHVGTNRPHLQATDCIVAPGRFSYRDMLDPFDKKRYPRGIDIHIHAESQIQCSLE